MHTFSGRAGSLWLLVVTLAACGPSGPTGSNLTLAGDDQILLVAMSEFGTADDGGPMPLPARLGVVAPTGGEQRSWEDPDSNVFHKALAYRDDTAGVSGVVTLGGTGAAVKLWATDGSTRTLWEADFGGEFSRMRDAEVGDLYGDGRPALAVATHDQGVVAVLRPNASGGFDVIELDAEPETFVHEIEIGDLDGDGVLEVYATPSEPNAVDGTAQPGSVVRYVPARDEGRTLAADLGDRHAKEILVTDLDGDGRDELYVAVEAVSGGNVDIRRYQADTPADAGVTIATLDARLCRFLTAGDVDGDGERELVAATYRGRDLGVATGRRALVSGARHRRLLELRACLHPPRSGWRWPGRALRRQRQPVRAAALRLARGRVDTHGAARPRRRPTPSDLEPHGRPPDGAALRVVRRRRRIPVQALRSSPSKRSDAGSATVRRATGPPSTPRERPPR